MHVLTILAMPVLCYSFGIFPMVSANILAIVMFLLTAIRYYGTSLIIFGNLKPAPSSMDMIMVQWATTFAMIAGLMVLWQIQYVMLFWFCALITPIAIYVQYQMTVATLLATKETSEDA